MNKKKKIPNFNSSIHERVTSVPFPSASNQAFEKNTAKTYEEYRTRVPKGDVYSGVLRRCGRYPKTNGLLNWADRLPPVVELVNGRWPSR